MDATMQTLVLKGVSLLSVILGFATPLTKVSQTVMPGVTISAESYLTKSCFNGQCTNYDGNQPDKLKAALAFACLALILSVVMLGLHFTAKPPNHALLGNLSIPQALCFLLSFAMVVAAMNDGSPKYNAGFAFLIIGTLTSAAHFAASKKAAASS